MAFLQVYLDKCSCHPLQKTPLFFFELLVAFKTARIPLGLPT